MKSRPRITISQTQRLALNIGLVASIQILRTDAAGLTRYLEEQAADNPQLVLDRATPTDWLPRWTEALGGDGRNVEAVASAGPSLIAHVMAQIDALTLTPPDRALALAFADALEPSGWLGHAVQSIATSAGHPIAQAEAVLARLQQFDPPGLFARNLADCLRLQAVEADLLTAPLTRMIDNLVMLAAGDPARIAQQLRLTEAQVTACLRTLRGFDPKPGAQFEPMAAPVREPDLVATKGPEGWQVALNSGALPTLRLAPDKGPRRAEARALMRLVEGRNATLLQVGGEVLLRQTAALEDGPGALVPMTMADVAHVLRLNQSTISRMVAGVAVDTPRGTWWLRALFTGRVGGEDGKAAGALRDALARLIAAEDRSAPLSDDALAKALSNDNAEVARRTVAKYRAALKIAPAHRRRIRPVVTRRALIKSAGPI